MTFLSDTMELHVRPDGTRWIIHARERCAGHACPFHAPSDHALREWPMHMRETTLVERICTHGVGHPDPDSVAYFDRIGRSGYDVHGCDGCCRDPQQ